MAFTGSGDTLSLTPCDDLTLDVSGPTAGPAGPLDDNLVIRAARGLAKAIPGLRIGGFHLIKRLPVAAGIGGGSSDAAAALRLLARLNDLPLDHPAIVEAARATGADVPVCLDPRGRMMRGAGEDVGPALGFAPLPAVLINPGVPVATAPVFKALGLTVGQRHAGDIHPILAARSRLRRDPGGGDAGSQRSGSAGAHGRPRHRRHAYEPARSCGMPARPHVPARARRCSACSRPAPIAVRAAVAIRSAQPSWWVRAALLR